MIITASCPVLILKIFAAHRSSSEFGDNFVDILSGLLVLTDELVKLLDHFVCFLRLFVDFSETTFVTLPLNTQ